MEPLKVAQLLGNRSLWRRSFWCYTAVLTIALLWPNLTIPPVIPRPDLVVHCVTFGLFALLLCLWNPLATSRQALNALTAFAVGVAYGGGTELLQSIPILHRTAALDDWAADTLGVVCGLLAFAALRWIGRSR